MKDYEKEIWKAINLPYDECKNYEVSSHGRVRNKITGKLRKLQTNLKGYITIGLNYKGSKKEFGVHRLVLYTFIGEPENENLTCDHIDRNKSNDYYKNLRWATATEQNLNKTKVKQKTTSKPILKIDPTTKEVIEEFSSLLKAAQSLGRVKGNSIIEHIKTQTLYKGYLWKYKTVENLKGEIWKSFKHVYVSNMGRFKDKKNRQLEGCVNVYREIKLEENAYKCHIIVCELFNGSKPDWADVVNHKNGNKLDNRASNLEWATFSENSIHAHKLHDHSKHTRIPVAKIDIKQNRLVKIYKSLREAAEDHNRAGPNMSVYIKTNYIFDFSFRFEKINRKLVYIE